MTSLTTITAGDLIRNAMILAHVRDAEDENPSWVALQGIRFLNEIIAQWGSLGIYIPFFTRTSVPITQGVYQYTVQPVITEILEANITDLNNVLNLVYVATDKQFNTWNFTTISGRPAWVYLDHVQVFPDPESSDLGSNIYLYPTPDQSYSLNLCLKNALNEIGYFEQLLEFPTYFMRPLRYELAKEFMVQYGTQVDNFEPMYQKVMAELKAANPQDLSTQVLNPFQQGWRFRPWGTYVG